MLMTKGISLIFTAILFRSETRNLIGEHRSTARLPLPNGRAYMKYKTLSIYSIQQKDGYKIRIIGHLLLLALWMIPIPAARTKKTIRNTCGHYQRTHVASMPCRYWKAPMRSR